MHTFLKNNKWYLIMDNLGRKVETLDELAALPHL
jgi:hypothetical protein